MKISKADLEDKVWFRALKVLFIFSYVLTHIFLIGGIIISVVSMFYGESGMGGVGISLLLLLIAIPYLFRLLATAFYYVVTGEWEFVAPLKIKRNIK